MTPDYSSSDSALAPIASIGDTGTVPHMPIKLAHFSDTHLGYEAYPALSAHGNNQRGEDIVRAFVNVSSDIAAWDPDLVIHSGDVLEKPKPDLRYMKAAEVEFAKLTRRPDGSLRPVVVLAGNHEQSRNRKEVCWLDLIGRIEGLFVVTQKYTRLRFDDRFPGLENVVVHAIPHDTLKTVDQTTIVPEDGAINILTAHGVAGGSELFFRALGREHAIDEDMLLRGWDYGALGHWHKQGPVTLGPGAPDPRIWYSGSTENMGFRDMRDNSDKRGYLRVELGDGPVQVTPVALPTRRMFRLPVVDAEGKTAADITADLLANIASADLDDAVVGQVVTNVPRDLWSLVDTAKVREAAAGALHFEITTRYAGAAASGDSPTDEQGPGELETLIATHLESVPEQFRDDVGTNVRSLVETYRARFEEAAK